MSTRITWQFLAKEYDPNNISFNNKEKNTRAEQQNQNNFFFCQVWKFSTKWDLWAHVLEMVCTSNYLRSKVKSFKKGKKVNRFLHAKLESFSFVTPFGPVHIWSNFRYNSWYTFWSYVWSNFRYNFWYIFWYVLGMFLVLLLVHFWYNI